MSRIEKTYIEDAKIAIEEIIEYIDGFNIEDYATNYDLESELSDHLHERIDGMIDIYYYDLRKWSVDHYEWIEEAIEEGSCEGVSDFHKIIQSGQYVFWCESFSEAIEEVFNELSEAK